LAAAPWESDPGIVNLPAIALIVMCALLLIRGASESAAVNTVMVVIKLGVLAMFAIIAALVIVTSVYVLVAIAALGTQPWQEFENQEEAGLATILDNVTGSTWASTILAAGAVISISSVTLVVMYGQTRILFAMGRDGLLPARFAKVNPKTMTPVGNTIIIAVVSRFWRDSSRWTTWPTWCPSAP
jgi:APA family basic amino acid/polyamine antiporter